MLLLSRLNRRNLLHLLHLLLRRLLDLLDLWWCHLLHLCLDLYLRLLLLHRLLLHLLLCLAHLHVSLLLLLLFLLSSSLCVLFLSALLFLVVSNALFDVSLQISTHNQRQLCQLKGVVLSFILLGVFLHNLDDSFRLVGRKAVDLSDQVIALSYSHRLIRIRSLTRCLRCSDSLWLWLVRLGQRGLLSSQSRLLLLLQLLLLFFFGIFLSSLCSSFLLHHLHLLF